LQLTRSCLYGVAFTAFAIGSPVGAQAPARSLLIRDVTLIDGTGAPSRVRDPVRPDHSAAVTNP
jgi:hypothetical protein